MQKMNTSSYSKLIPSNKNINWENFLNLIKIIFMLKSIKFKNKNNNLLKI
jgi:hypothetical protein